MAKVIFYEKPDCALTQQQKTHLIAAGYEIETRDLTAEHWTPAGLRAYFANRPVAEWFDPRASKILSGEIDPASANAQMALVMMTSDPNLIRSPLIKFDGRCASGLDPEELDHFLAHKRGGAPFRPEGTPEHWTGDSAE